MFSQMNPTQSDCSCWRNVSFRIITSLPHSFGAERIARADESLKDSLTTAQSLLEGCVSACIRPQRTQRAAKVPGNRALRGQHGPGVVTLY